MQLATILKLKKSTTPGFPGPMGWRELGKRIGMSGQLAHYHAKRLLGEKMKHRCPTCLQKLEEEK